MIVDSDAIAPILVLIVEDEWLIRMAAFDALTDAGFEVLEAQHAAEALEHLEHKSREVMIICTDVNMPGEMDGLALAHHADRLWPWIALIVTSGKAALLPEHLPVGAHFMPKPYELENLALLWQFRFAGIEAVSHSAGTARVEAVRRGRE